MTPQQRTHIPLSVQAAAKMFKEMISAQHIVESDIRAGNIRLTDEDKQLFHTLALDIDFYLNTIRFLIFSRIIEATAGYDPRDGSPGTPQTEVPDDMTTELITDKLKHETTTDRPDQSGYMSDEPTDIDGAMVITEDTYSEIHRFNQQTNGYSPSDEIQECFDEAMQGAFTTLKIQYHFFIKAKKKNFLENQRWSGY